MNGTLYQNPTFPTINNEEDFKEKDNNSLQNNKGKMVKVYLSFSNKDTDFEGRLEFFGEKYIIISNIETNEYNLIPIKHINYIIFNEKIDI